MTDASITIRAASLEDYPRVREVIVETLDFHRQALPHIFQPTDTPPPTLEFVTSLLDRDNGALLLAEHEGRVVGFLTIRLAHTPDQPYLIPRQIGVIDNVGIRLDWRRHGIGRALVEAAHEWARNKGLTEVQLTVWEFNQGAISLYESLGYTTATRNMWRAL